MAEIADRISQATGTKVRHVRVTPEQRRQAMITHDVPVKISDALIALDHKRVKGGPESQVDLSTHRLFNIRPTTFLEFAQRNAGAFKTRSNSADPRRKPE